MLPALPGDNSCTLVAINNKGQIVGDSYDEGPSTEEDLGAHAVLWLGGKAHDLGIGVPKDINNTGDVIGFSFGKLGSNTQHAILWRRGRALDLGTLGGRWSWAEGINADDTIVGAAHTGRNWIDPRFGTAALVSHAFVWRSGRMSDLTPRLPGLSVARSINAQGVIVGQFLRGRDFHAVLWRNEGAKGWRMFDLSRCLIGAMGWTLMDASKINARGQVLAEGRHLGRSYSVLLTPVSGGMSGQK